MQRYLLSEFIKIKNNLIKFLLAAGLKSCRLMQKANLNGLMFYFILNFKFWYFQTNNLIISKMRPNLYT